MRILLMLIAIIFLVNNSLARRFYKYKHPNFREKFISESRSNCGKVPRLKHRSPLQTTSFGEIPWQVGIFDEKDGSFLCSGTLISNELVLTASVCLISIETKNGINLRLGDWDISANDSPYEAYKEFRTPVKKIVLLEDYNNDSVPSLATIALLFMEEKVDFSLYPQIAPICLPDFSNKDKEGSNSESHNNCTVSGWGIQQPSSDVLQQESPIFYSSDISSVIENNDQASLNQEDFTTDPLQDEDTHHFSSYLTLSKTQIGPLSISIPIFLSDKEQERYYKGSSDVYHTSIEEINRRESDIVADDYSSNIKGEGIDPVKNGDLGFPFVNHNLPSTTIDDTYNSSENTSEASDNFAVHFSMFRHKQKYNSGKTSSWNNARTETPKVTNDSIDIESSGDVHKRNDAQDELKPIHFTLPNFFTKVFDDDSGEFLIQPILKQANITLKVVCEQTENPDAGNEVIAKSCIIPTDKLESPSLCMVDLGSPVSCKQKLVYKKYLTRSIASGSKFQNFNLSSNNTGYGDLSEKKYKKSMFSTKTVSRFVLAGIVSWKRPCYANDDNLLQKYTMVTDTQSFLKILFDQLEKEKD